MNIVKHGPGSGKPARLTIASFAKLQARADALVGQGASLSAADRESLLKLKVGSVTVGEGHLVTVNGYLIGDPHPNDHETVNCNLTGKDNDDFHIRSPIHPPRPRSKASSSKRSRRGATPAGRTRR